MDNKESIDTDRDGIGNNSDSDDDNDDITDDEEITLGTDPLKSDSDSDGLKDGDEIKAQTDPLNPDSDGDGSPDGSDDFPLDPNISVDTDRDGVSDQKEKEIRTNPENPDTDGDGVGDCDERNLYATDPLDENSLPLGRYTGSGCVTISHPSKEWLLYISLIILFRTKKLFPNCLRFR